MVRSRHGVCKLAHSAMAYLHHLVIHFAIALAIVGVPCWLIAWRKQGSWLPAARGLAYTAAAASVVAAASGLLSAAHVIEMGGDPERIATHRNLALVAAGIMVVAASLVWRQERHSGKRWLVTGVFSLAAVSLAVASHFGADMLHPGLAPWSNVPHHHGPSSDGQHPHPDEHTAGGVPLVTAPAMPSVPVAPVGAIASAAGQPAATNPAAPAGSPHDHSQHKH
ncbi:MAG: hypothetical protein IPI67_23945 [Myxococcales bacterium]|nr:hypothetical protein [Myxococcales bacterium]